MNIKICLSILSNLLILRIGLDILNFDHLKNHTQQNLNMANQMEDGVIMMGVSFKQVLVDTQTQSLRLINEIERSANVGIGYAFELVEMRKYFE